MGNQLTLTRKLGDREPIRVKVIYPETYDLSAASLKFYMDAGDGTPKVSGQTATATDITPAGRPPLSIWRLSYAPTAADLNTTGTYTAEFEVDLGGGQKRYYPRDSDLAVVVTDHPAT